MPSALRRPRAAVLALVLLLVAGLGVVRPIPAAAPRSGVNAPGRGSADLVRAPWFGMRLLHTTTRFEPVAPAGDPPAVSARAGLLVDLDTHAILWQHDAHAELPPASTVKVLTALVALANLSPARSVTVTADALDQAADESRMGLKAGETLTVGELLTGMLLVSGNDAATAIAADTVGLERFVAAMNAQVAALGLRDSHFSNPVGLSDPGLYTSAYDLAVVSAVAVASFPLFRAIVAMRSADLPASGGHPEFQLQSINQLLSLYPAAVGIKPGWTSDAGYCEVGMAVRDGHRLLSVLLNAPYPYRQTRQLLDWGFVHEGLPSTLPTPRAVPSPSA